MDMVPFKKEEKMRKEDREFWEEIQRNYAQEKTFRTQLSPPQDWCNDCGAWVLARAEVHEEATVFLCQRCGSVCDCPNDMSFILEEREALERALSSFAGHLKTKPQELGDLLQEAPADNHAWEGGEKFTLWLLGKKWLRYKSSLWNLRSALRGEASSHWLAYWRKEPRPKCPTCGRPW